MPLRFVIIGGGPAGNTAATWAARLGADVTMIERDIVGGAAHLWDCIPSKTMIATGGAMSFTRRIEGMGLDRVQAEVDMSALKDRVEGIVTKLNSSIEQLLQSQRVRMIRGTARLDGPHRVARRDVHRRGGAGRRRRADRHRLPAPHPRLVHARRRPHPHDPRSATRRRCCPSTSS